MSGVALLPETRTFEVPAQRPCLQVSACMGAALFFAPETFSCVRLQLALTVSIAAPVVLFFHSGLQSGSLAAFLRSLGIVLPRAVSDTW